MFVYFNQPEVDAEQLTKDLHERLRNVGVSDTASLDLIKVIKIDFLWPKGVDASNFKEINKVCCKVFLVKASLFCRSKWLGIVTGAYAIYTACVLGGATLATVATRMAIYACCMGNVFVCCYCNCPRLLVLCRRNLSCSVAMAIPDPALFVQVYFGGEAGTTEGYNHMIRFWMTYFFDQPDIKGLDYYMRLDTDSFILSKIEFDIFQEVQVYSRPPLIPIIS